MSGFGETQDRRYKILQGQLYTFSQTTTQQLVPTPAKHQSHLRQTAHVVPTGL